MDQTIAQQRIKWLILALAALTIMGSYCTYDSIAPVAGIEAEVIGEVDLLLLRH